MGMEKPPVFNPRDEKYKKVEDLPETKQSQFVNSGDGFIERDAENTDAINAMHAKDVNDDRTMLEKMLGRNKKTSIDVSQDEALDMNREKDLNILKKQYKEATWQAYEQATNITVKLDNHAMPSRIWVESKEDLCNYYADMSKYKDTEEMPEVFDYELKLSDLIKQGKMMPEQLVEMFDVKLDTDPYKNEMVLKFTGKLKNGWEEKLGEILGKKVNS